jgi:hypothetical protein
MAVDLSGLQAVTDALNAQVTITENVEAAAKTALEGAAAAQGAAITAAVTAALAADASVSQASLDAAVAVIAPITQHFVDSAASLATAVPANTPAA